MGDLWDAAYRYFQKIDRVLTGRIVLWSYEIAGSHNATGRFSCNV